MHTDAIAFEALRDRSYSRIEWEWQLTERERKLLRAIEKLSFGCKLASAAIRRQEDLAEACEMHKTDVSRLLTRLVNMGALSFFKNGQEIHYAIELDSKDVPKRDPGKQVRRQEAMEKLVQEQINRHGGTADTSTQLRMRTVLPADGCSLDGKAMSAIVELQKVKAAAEQPEPAEVARQALELRRRLDALPDTQAFRTRLGDYPEDPRTKDVEKYRVGLTFEEQYLWDRLVRQIQSGLNPNAWPQFVQHADKWQSRVRKYRYALSEAVGSHELLRTPARIPGAWIYGEMMKICGEDVTTPQREA
jgi:predicted transcriptional regulator